MSSAFAIRTISRAQLTQLENTVDGGDTYLDPISELVQKLKLVEKQVGRTGFSSSYRVITRTHLDGRTMGDTSWFLARRIAPPVHVDSETLRKLPKMKGAPDDAALCCSEPWIQTIEGLTLDLSKKESWHKDGPFLQCVLMRNEWVWLSVEVCMLEMEWNRDRDVVSSAIAVVNGQPLVNEPVEVETSKRTWGQWLGSLVGRLWGSTEAEPKAEPVQNVLPEHEERLAEYHRMALITSVSSAPHSETAASSAPLQSSASTAPTA